MSDRRITASSFHAPPDPNEMPAKLKQIAGLIHGLTFVEMKKLADLMHAKMDTSGRPGIEEELLDVADEILTK